MDNRRMDELIDAHIRAEIAGDVAGAVAVYTDDVEHDVVGWPTGPTHGPEAARGFYGQLMADFTTETMERTSSRYGEDFCVTEHQWSGTVPGSFMDVPGDGRHVTFRILHVWDFRDGAISRENVWLDGGAIVAQLTGAA